MKRVFKYPLQVADKQEIQLPASSKILSVEEQGGQLVLYALVNDTVKMMNTFVVIIHGTGHDADDTDGCDYVNTVKMYDGRIMFHVFIRRQLNDQF